MSDQKRAKYPHYLWSFAGFAISGIFLIIAFVGALGEPPKHMSPLWSLFWKIGDDVYFFALLGVPILSITSLILFGLDLDKWAWHTTIAATLLGPLFFLLIFARTFY